MIHTGKCPKCEASLRKVKAGYVDIEGGSGTFKGVAYICPHCNSVLSVAIDPLALKSETVSEIVKALRRA